MAYVNLDVGEDERLARLQIQ